MKKIHVNKLQREIDYRPLTEATINNQKRVDEMVKRLQNIKPGERITYFSGMTGTVNSPVCLAKAVWDQLKKFEHTISAKDGTKWFYSAVFLSEKIEIRPGCNVFDYMVVGK